MTRPNRARSNGLKAVQTVEKVLTDVGWEPEQTDVEGVLRVDFSTDNTPVADALADVRIDTERFVFYLNLRDRASMQHRAHTMEFVTRANFNLVIGNFELNLEDGSVRLKASIDFTQLTLSAKLATNTIQSAMDVMEAYADALVCVMRGEQTAQEALEDIEG